MFLQDSNGNRRASIEFPTSNFSMAPKNPQLPYGHNVSDRQYNMQSIMGGANTSSRKYYE